MMVGLTHRRPVADEARYQLVALPRQSIEAVRDAVAGSQSTCPNLTLEGVVIRAFESVVDDLAERYNGGQPFPRRTGQLPRGRRRKSA